MSDDIKKSAEEALAIARGEMLPAGTYVPGEDSDTDQTTTDESE